MKKSEDSDAADSPVCCGLVSRYTYLTALLVAINVFLFADQNLMAPVLTPMARDLGMVKLFENGTVMLEFDEALQREVAVVDAELRDKHLGGDITLAFFMIGGTASLLVGYLTDTVNRRNTLAVVVVLGEASCAAAFFTTDFRGLLVSRALTGVAIGGAVPLLYSLFGDLFPIERRGKAVAAASMAMSVGMGIGQMIAGPIAGPDGSNWRLAFLVVATPAFPLVALLLATVPEPPRGTKEEAFLETGASEYSAKLSWEKFLELFRTPTICLVFLQGIPGSLPWGVMLGFFQDFLTVEKSISVSLSGLVLLAFGLGLMLGNVAGGIMCDRLASRMRLVPLIMGITTMVGAVPMWALVNAPSLHVGLYMAVLFPTGCSLGLAGTAVRAVLVNVCLPEARGSAFSVFNLFDDIGKGFGTFLISRIIVLAGSRTAGISIAFLGWVACGLMHISMYFFIEGDYRRAQLLVRRQTTHRRELPAPGAGVVRISPTPPCSVEGDCRVEGVEVAAA